MKEITIEKVDQVLERLPYVSYKEAKEALEKTDGDVLDAIILIEGREKNFSKVSFDEIEVKLNEGSEKLKEQVKSFIKKSGDVRLVIEKEGKIILNLPIGVGFIGAVMMPIASLIGLSAAVLSKYSIKIVDESKGEGINLGSMSYEKLRMLKDIINETYENVKEAVVTKQERKSDEEVFSIDITEDLISEKEAPNKIEPQVDTENSK